MWFLGKNNYSLCLSSKFFAEKQSNTQIKKSVHNEKKQQKLNWNVFLQNCKSNNNKNTKNTKYIAKKKKYKRTIIIKKLFIPNPKKRLCLPRRLQLFKNPKP
jgi:hypothetical protein